MRDAAWVGWVGILAFIFPGVGFAQQPMQPSGTLVPVGGALQGYLTADGDTIVPSTDARTTPETFKPECELTFTVISRGGIQNNSFGWYNVTGVKPQVNELYEFLGCNDAIGTRKVLDILKDSRYLGGEIGFFQATTEGKMPPNCVDYANPATTLGHVFYSQKAYNEDNVMGAASYIHLLIMDSKVRPSSYYFGWEDLFMGGDNDFEDLLTRVDGIQCPGGGADCDTGMPGHCAKGVMRCVNGKLTCTPRSGPSPETCNALDDDCNAKTDDGDLCDPGFVCDHGTCIKRCNDTEFQCPSGFECRSDGYCVDADCIDVTCKEDQICIEGTCVGACDGVTCPHGNDCVAGSCVNPCADVTCPAGQVCELGACVSCCSGCPDGKMCDAKQTVCTTLDCVDVPCPGWAHCKAGKCVDSCDGVVCPKRQTCTDGVCTIDPDAGTSGPTTGGVGGGGGRRSPPPINADSDSGVGGSGGSGSGGSGGMDGSHRRADKASSACLCSVPGRRGHSRAPAWMWLSLPGLLAARIRRPRARAAARGSS